jgi:hypothetical protein
MEACVGISAGGSHSQSGSADYGEWKEPSVEIDKRLSDYLDAIVRAKLISLGVAALIRARLQRTPDRLHEEVVSDAYAAYHAAKTDGADEAMCRRRADAAMTRARQPKGSRRKRRRPKGSRRDGQRKLNSPETAFTAIPRESPVPDVDELEDERGDYERWAGQVVLPVLPAHLRRIAEAKFLRNESDVVVAKALGLTKSAVRGLTGEARRRCHDIMTGLDRRGLLPRASGIQRWKRDVLDYLEGKKPVCPELPPGWELREVRGKLTLRRRRMPRARRTPKPKK